VEEAGMESEDRELSSLVNKLSQIIREKRNGPQSGDLNEQWTKIALIVPLLEGLGWDRVTDISYEVSPNGNEELLDLILNCKNPIGVMVKKPDEIPPRNFDHPQINAGLRQCKVKKIPYFIWTNGDCWQFASLALPNAPLYQIVLSEAVNGASTADQLLIIKKDIFTSSPERFDRAIHDKFRMIALPIAWKEVLIEHTDDLIQLIRKRLHVVDIKDEVILKFLKTLRPDSLHPSAKYVIGTPTPKDWEQLIESYESPYRLARWFFRTSYYHKLGTYIISESYKPWSKAATWTHVGLSNSTHDRKKISHAVILFREWGFIKEAGNDKYYRVEESIPYLKKLLEKPA
jgi:hypothetical protein